ncbi:MAG: murein biosynthesis integral membrane protein MurJ [Rhodobacteraceae bacterium]|nr:murein biosynthesis integral membrane protein MurJ [Paracoccaceae bacterium]
MSLLRAFATVGSFTLLSRVTGFLRDILTASFLGAGTAADAFLIAFQFPNLFRRLFAEGAFSAGFVPIFSRVLEKDGHDKAADFANAAFAMLATVVFVFVVVMVILMPWALYVIAPGFDRIPGQMDHTAELARIAFPYLLFISLVSLQSGITNSFDRFAAGAAAPIILNLTIAAFLLGGVEVGVRGDVAMAMGVTVAGMLQYLWMARAVNRLGIHLKMTRPRLTPEVRDLMKRMLPVAFGAGIYQLNLMIDKILATLVSVGAVSWLYYADRVNQLPVGVVGVAIGVALLPLLSRQIQAGSEDAAMANQNRAIEVCLLLTIPAAAGIWVLAGPITATLFERGAFTIRDRNAVAAALDAFALGLPAYVLNKALTPGFFGRLDTKTPVIISGIAMGTNVVFSVTLMQFVGHVGIAAATSLSAWINAGALGWVLHRRGHFKVDARLFKRTPRIVAASALMVAALLGVLTLAEAWLGSVFGGPDHPPAAEIVRVLVLVAAIGIGSAVYFTAVFALGAFSRADLAAFKRNASDAPHTPATPDVPAA